MLTTLQEILAPARAGAYAVPAFDCVEDVMVRTVLETAEALRSPVIVMCLAPRPGSLDMAYLAGLVRAVADAHTIPIALHLDHATELDSIKEAIDRGFTSVMIDGSQRQFEENVALSRAAAELAHPLGVGVEAELGYVGGMDLAESVCGESVLTQPGEVTRFVEETGVDALAVSIGTAHGVYRELPHLAIDRLIELNAASAVPLVLHGGPARGRQIRQAVAQRIFEDQHLPDNRIAWPRVERGRRRRLPIDPLLAIVRSDRRG